MAPHSHQVILKGKQSLRWQTLMESLTCPCCCFLPLHHRSHIPARAKFSQQLYFVKKFSRHRNYRFFRFAVCPTALNSTTALAKAAVSHAAAAAAGDLSVLIPISVLMLSLYWVANFMVPGMITKDLQGQPAASAEETDEKSTRTGDENLGGVEPNHKVEEPKGINKTTAGSTAR